MFLQAEMFVFEIQNETASVEVSKYKLMIQMTTSQFSKVLALLTVSHCSQPTFAEQLQATL